MTDFARRVKMRALAENPETAHNRDIGRDLDLDACLAEDDSPLVLRHVTFAEQADTANPIAATAIVRKDAVTEIAPPDVEALLAAFNRPEETP